MQQSPSPPSFAIVNPTAGNGRAGREWSAVSRQLADAGLLHDVAFTERRGDATTLCRDALARGVKRIIAVGGDGTLNEVANGFFEEYAPSNDAIGASMGLIPLGTGSDVARSVGITGTTHAVETLRLGTTRTLDVGAVRTTQPDGTQTHRIFLNVADAGIGADAARRLNQNSKRLGSLLSYLRAAVQAITHYQPANAAISVDDQPALEGQASIIVVANMRYFGGGMLVAPHALPDDGAFDLLYLGGATKRRLLFDLLPRVYVGKHVGHKQVVARRAKRVSISSDPPLPLELDGEQWGTTPVSFELVPYALPLIVPPARP
jgi:diacylglycerol kinase (ATP)